MQPVLSPQWVLTLNNNNMGHNNGIITAPVSIDDVRQTIYESSTDLGTLCTSNNIKKNSKIKPIQATNLSLGSTFEELVNAMKAPTNGQHFGFTIPQKAILTSHSSSTDSLQNLINSNIADWIYNKSTGGITSPYRLGDFICYYHNANNFREMNFFRGVEHITQYETDVIKGETISMFMKYDTTPPEETPPPLEKYCLNFIDFDIFSGFYLSFMLIKNVSENASVITSQTPIKRGDVGSLMNISTNNLTVGTYKLAPFLSSNFISNTFTQQDISGGIYYPISNAQHSLIVKIGEITYSIRNIVRNGATLSFTIDITNSTQNTATINLLYAYGIYSGWYDGAGASFDWSWHNDTPPALPTSGGRYNQIMSTTTIAAQQTLAVNAQITSLTPTLSLEYIALYYYDTKNMHDSNFFDV
jgi:hypothetical protein